MPKLVNNANVLIIGHLSYVGKIYPAARILATTNLRYVSDYGGSLRFWHVFDMVQRPDLSEIMELGHD